MIKIGNKIFEYGHYPEVKAKIDVMHKRNSFKLQLMPSFVPTFGE